MFSPPVVGIVADFRPATSSRAAFTFLYSGYFDLVVKAGGTPLILPPLCRTEQVAAALDVVDGVILTGGDDLDPRKLGMIPHPAVRPMPARREQFDRTVARLAQERKIPILGICLGMEVMNAVYGGTLYQHLPEEMPKGLPHADPVEPGHRHTVDVKRRTRMAEIYGVGELRVNSQHHQGVRKVAPGFIESAVAPDKLVEAIESQAKDWWAVGVQWHPESETASALDQQLFEAFVAACCEHPAVRIAA